MVITPNRRGFANPVSQNFVFIFLNFGKQLFSWNNKMAIALITNCLSIGYFIGINIARLST